jgi:hypothetical protein
MSITSTARRSLVAAAVSAGLVLGATLPATAANAATGAHHCPAGKHSVKRHGKRFCVKLTHRVAAPAPAAVQSQPAEPAHVQGGEQPASASLPAELASLDPSMLRRAGGASTRAVTTIGGYEESGESIWSCQPWSQVGAYYIDWCINSHISINTGIADYNDWYRYYWNRGWVLWDGYRCPVVGNGCSKIA